MRVSILNETFFPFILGMIVFVLGIWKIVDLVGLGFEKYKKYEKKFEVVKK